VGYPIRKGTGPWGSDIWSGTSGSISYTTASGTPSSGDLVVLWIVKDDDVAPGTPSDGGATFTLIDGGATNAQAYATLYAKFADGTEGSSISWSSDSEEGVAFLTVIDGGASSIYQSTLGNVIQNSTIQTYDGVAQIPTTSLSTGWGASTPTLWVCLGGTDSNSVVTGGTPWFGYPLQFQENTDFAQSSGGAGAAGAAVAERQFTTDDSTDFATTTSHYNFQLDDAEETIGTLVAIRGTTPTLGYLPNAPTPSLRDTTPPTATADSTTISINKPDNTADGDLLVAVINFDAEGTARTFSSTGWTYQGAVESSTPNIGIYFLTKIADSEGSSWTFTVSGTSGSMAGEVHAIQNGEWNDWLDGVGYEFPGSTTADTGSLTGVKGIIFGTFAGGAFGPTVTWTVDGDLTEISDTTRYFANLATGYRTESSPTSVGPYTGTADASQDPRAAAVWAVGPGPGFDLDAVILSTVAGSFTVDATLFGTTTVSSGWQLYHTIEAASAPSYRIGVTLAVSADGSVIASSYDLEDAAWVWYGNKWDTEKKVTGINDFGGALALTSDGSKLVVGSETDNTDDDEAGGIWVFESSDDYTSSTRMAPASPGYFAHFGSSIAISGDDSVLVVGARYYDGASTSPLNRGCAYAFYGTDWGTEARLDQPSPVESEWMGSRVSVNGDGSVICASSPYRDGTPANIGTFAVFYGTTWGSSVQRVGVNASDSLGHTTAFFDNDDLLVGRINLTDAWHGELRKYTQSSTWASYTTVTEDVPTDFDAYFPTFGSTLSITTDDTLATGQDAYDNGATDGRFQRFDVTDWSYEDVYPPPGETGTGFGYRAISPKNDSNMVVVAAPFYGVGGKGKIFIYRYGQLRLEADAWIAIGGDFTVDASIAAAPEAAFPVDAVRFVFDQGGDHPFDVDAFLENAYFTTDAVIYKPEFTVDAVLGISVEDVTFTVDARFASGGDFIVSAAIHREWSSVIHSDGMSPDEVATWGSPDIGNDYTYSASESLWAKTSGVGTFGPTKDQQPTIYWNDQTWPYGDKEVYVEWATSGRGNLNSQSHRFGLNSRVYFVYRCTNNNAVGTPDYLDLYVDGVLRGTRHYLPAKYNASYPRLAIRYRAESTTIKVKVWERSATEPDWQITYDASVVGYTPTNTRAYWRSGASSYFGTEGPWTYYWDNLTITPLDLPPLTVDAYIYIVTNETDFTLDARVGPWFVTSAFVQPYFRLDAEIYYATLVIPKPPLVRAYISLTSSKAFSANAVIAGIDNPYFFARAAIFGEVVGAAYIDAEIGDARFFWAAAVIGTKVTWEDFLVVRSWIDDTPLTKTFSGDDGWPIDAHIDGPDGTVELDAVITDGVYTYTYALDAEFASVGESGGTFTLDALRSIVGDERFLVAAVVAQNAPLRLDAWLAGTLTLDAVLAHLGGSGSLTADACLAGTLTHQMHVDAVVVDGSGDYHGAHADAIILGTQADERLHFIEVLAKIIGSPEKSFSLDAVLVQAFTLDARFYRPVFVDAFIASDQFIVYPPSQDGDSADTTGTSQDGSDGVAVSGTTFSAASADFTGMEGAAIVIDGQTYIIESVTSPTTVVISGGTIAGSGLSWSIPTLTDPDASFDDSLIGQTIVIEGISYTIIDVLDENTVIVGGADEWPYANGGIEWYIASGDPTDPLGDPPPTTRISQVLIEWSRPDKESWTDLTGDVLPEGTTFTQSARVGPGTFEMTLKDAHSEFVGGEEIRVSVDGYRVFGGYVSDVERGYAFEDDAGQPLVFLKGTDYNALLDRLLVYNAEWDEKKEGSGGYRTWKPFSKGTLDSTIIKTVATRYMSDPGKMGLDMTTYVDTIETPAPTTGFQMESGMSLRNLLTEISRITEGVWYIDPFKNLHYHSREVVTSEFPITDGDGGIACRGLKISTSLSVVTNDVFVWGTQAFMDTGDSDIIYSRQTADQDWDVDWWASKITDVQAKIDAIKETPYDQRTLKQRTKLEALRKTKSVYNGYLTKAQATTEDGSVGRLGRWQTGEFRQDIYQQGKVDRRAKAIMQRYSEPVTKAQATVFDPSFGAGQVAQVVSIRHGVADELPIRQMTIDFATAKEPVGDTYYAVPRYTLTLGLDPEEPWDIYQFLPFPDLPDLNVHFNIPTIRIVDPVIDIPGIAPLYLDTFDREWNSQEDFGTAANERDETREWEVDA